MDNSRIAMQIIDDLAGEPVVHPGAIPPEQWGKDHWSTFGYVGSVVTNRRGRPDRTKMRCDPDLHPGLDALPFLGRNKKYPTLLKRLSDDTVPTLDNHDDWSCVEDFESAGLLVWGGSGINPILRFTEAGWALHHEFQRHIANNPGRWSTTFHPDPAMFPRMEKPSGNL